MGKLTTALPLTEPDGPLSVSLWVTAQWVRDLWPSTRACG